MDYYTYNGPVEMYGKPIDHRFSASTYAPSKKKAMDNLIYRYKKEHGYANRVVITLPGKLDISERS